MSQDFTSLPHPDKVIFEMVDTDDALKLAAEHWSSCDVVAIDTEFVRERTYYPALGLVQIAAADRVFLIDPLAIEDVTPLIEMLENPELLKAVHSGSEDLEVLSVHFDALPQPLFDTQIAAALAGRGYSPGYARLIDDLFTVTIPKGETRSNWLRRPLRPAQLHYAALDVFYLLPAQDLLSQELDSLGRSSWMAEEGQRQIEVARRDSDDHELYLKVGRGRHMSRHQLAVLRDLMAWREREARKRDLPRNFVVKEQTVINLALRRPRSFDRLQQIDGMDKKTADRHGRAMLRVIRLAAELREEALPEAMARVTDLSKHKESVATLREEVKKCANELGVAPELLANRRTIEKLKRRALDGTSPLLPRALRGWRAEVVGPSLIALLESGA